MAPLDAATGTFTCEGCGAEFGWDGGDDAVHPSCPAALTSDGDRHHQVTDEDRDAVAAARADDPAEPAARPRPRPAPAPGGSA